MEEYIRVSAKTVDDAITEALIQLETTSDNIEYEVLETGSSGFFGIGSKPAVIRARRKKSEDELFAELKLQEEKKAEVRRQEAKKPEQKKPEVKKSEPRRQEVKREEKKEEPKKAEARKAEPKVPINEEEAIARAKKFLDNVFKSMDMNVQINAVFEDDNMIVDLSGDDMGILIGKRGQTLDSLQYLTSLVVNKGKSAYVRVKVDTENYRNRRKETLENLARNIAGKVKRTRKPVFLEPMNPYERRIIHSALQNDPYVSTHSEGEEPYRKVVITLKK